MDALRVGLVGAGLMGLEHARNLLAIDGAVVTAVADPEAASIEAVAGVLSGSASAGVTLVSDHRDLLAAGCCDAIIVSTPNMTHAGIALDVVAAGLPVLVEKPVCTTVADCRRLEDAVAGAEAIVWVGLEYRFMPPIARLLAEVASGTTGSVRMVAIREHRFPFLTKVGDWNRFNRNSGGTLVEKCCHFFDLMRLVTSAEPVTVMASGGQDVNHLDESYGGERPDILDNAYVIVEFDSGARGMLDLCMFADASHNEQEVSVLGAAGKLEALLPAGTVRIGRRGEHWLGRVDEVGEAESAARYEGLHHGSSYVQDLRFVDAVRHGLPAAVSVGDGLMSVAMGVAAQRSIAEGRIVAMAEVLDG